MYSGETNTGQIGERIVAAKYVALFGSGVLLHESFHQLKNFLGRTPDFICDNNPEKWGSTWQGIRCIAPEELTLRKDDTLVVITVKQYESIHAQLLSLGVKNILIAAFDRGYHVRNLFIRDQQLEQFESDVETSISAVQGKWTFITGASRGIGRRIALEMAGYGSNLILHSRALEHTKHIEKACRELGVEVIPVAAEFAETAGIDAFLDKVLALGKPIDLVFSNAAVSPAHPEEIWIPTSEEYINTLKINTIVPIRILQKMIPPMLKRGFGRIVNVTSNIQFRPHELGYTVSKAALDTAVVEFADYIKESRVSLTLVDPGWVKTSAGGPGALFDVESVIPGVLLGAFLGPEFNGHRFNAQDYSNLTLGDALKKVWQHKRHYGYGRWI